MCSYLQQYCDAVTCTTTPFLSFPFYRSGTNSTETFHRNSELPRKTAMHPRQRHITLLNVATLNRTTMDIRNLLCDDLKSSSFSQSESLCEEDNRLAIQDMSIESRQILDNPNPKVLYHRTFNARRMPTVCELRDWLVYEQYFSINEVDLVITSICDKYNENADDNIFTAVLLLLLKPNITTSDLQFFRTVYFPPCTRCKKSRPNPDYLCYERPYLYEICNSCRKKYTVPPENRKTLCFKSVSTKECLLFGQEFWFKMTTEAAQFLQLGTICMLSFEQNGFENINQDAVTEVQGYVERIEGYNYVRPQWIKNEQHGFFQ